MSDQPLLFLFLVCSPDLDTLFGFGAPQPFVEIYALALGRGGQLVMTIIAVLGLLIVRPYCRVHRSYDQTPSDAAS